MEKVRVVVQAADHLSMTGLIAYLGSRSDVRVLENAQHEKPDVVVVAVNQLTTEVVSRLRRAAAHVGAPVVLIVDEVGEADVLTAVECRIVAVLPRSTVTDQLVLRSVLSAASGGGVMPPNMVAELLRHVQRLQQQVLSPEGGPDRLSAREADVLRLMADGLDTAEIAGRLSYSERTIKNVFYGITTRLNLRNRPHAVAYALRKGMI
ncbi:DNA-binding NarL/FixJ family response regulator [Saccharothrix ecbatanensis]|uniref:DNA-binding NarL/FixJ family response regulator n=1 Tax=Saccharothrix ecbatanensis TaxID=1105145 RepID=A0A7W9LZW5_9PSEU|nr:response regulator transcription factor [Saccharothrix ecbatanensis]MBB5802153.1 DNA-binding NarL/FixJ family response regulator [Saccharothrix ecbatanensis]